ncbi:MAG TPA: hemolysin family protein [Blastocatellia bacterium]|nr:hemolysin family protein [Blastocatellia bacterium]
MGESSLWPVILKLVAVLLLVLANGFFVATEYALVSVRRSRITSLVSQGNKRARTVMRVLDSLTSYISATQLGVTLASLALGWVGEDTMAHLLEPVFNRILGSLSAVAAHTTAIVLAYILITYLHVVLGELVPKALSLEKAESVALVTARPIELFYKLFKAPIWILNHSGVTFLRLLGLRATAEHAAIYSEEELRQLIALSHKSGHVIEDERRLIDNVFEFTEATVESIMTPRTEIEALDIEIPPQEMLDIFEELGYSRMPIYRGSLDNVVGIVLYKDLCRVVRRGELADINTILRPAVILPTSVRLHDALRMLRRSSAHMALVVDEHGGVEGLVTLEDLLEEIVGDISDEHDEAAAQQIKKLNEDSFKVSGKLTIRDANRRLGLGLPESDSYHTVAGFMMARAGKMLAPGDSIDYNGMKLTVENANRNRIVEARIERVKEDAPAPKVVS